MPLFLSLNSDSKKVGHILSVRSSDCYLECEFEGMDKDPGLCDLWMLLLWIFFFYGYIKDRVFDIAVPDVEELKTKMQAVECTVQKTC